MSEIESFSPVREQALVAALDEILPASADGRLPAGGFMVAAGLLERTFSILPDMRVPIAFGLDALDRAAAARGRGPFAALDADERRAVLDEVSAADPGFLPTLMFLAYVSYYADPGVLAGIGFEPRPPHPGGYSMAPNDLGLLDPVRARGRIWREA
ncbi:gluconate 2-dehydrogenase subunit 3 family protein [bacterium]|nr:gluconate 2-dehydrogenase subunit 3 family protein [bacterium]